MKHPSASVAVVVRFGLMMFVVALTSVLCTGSVPLAGPAAAPQDVCIVAPPLGSILGVLPGGGALLSSFAAYTVEKKMRMKPGEVPFGEGNIRGVAGPEAANNAGAQTSFIPMLTLGIPPNAVMALNRRVELAPTPRPARPAAPP